MPACVSLSMPCSTAVSGNAGSVHKTSSTLEQGCCKCSWRGKRASNVASREFSALESPLLRDFLSRCLHQRSCFETHRVRWQQKQACNAYSCQGYARTSEQRQEVSWPEVPATLASSSASKLSALAAVGSVSSRRGVLAGLLGVALISTYLECAEAALESVSNLAGDGRQNSGNKAQTKAQSKVFELDGGLKALDVRIGTGAVPQQGDKIAIHYYGRLGAKQGWRFDSSYEHKDLFGVPEPYVFQVGSGQVIAGIDTAVRSMHVGGIRRVVIPPSQGYQNKEQGPIPPDFFDRQRLYTTIFNPTRLANGEGATLGTVIFDLELVRIQAKPES